MLIGHLLDGIRLTGRQVQGGAVHHPEVRQEKLDRPAAAHVVEVTLEQDTGRLILLGKLGVALRAEHA